MNNYIISKQLYQAQILLNVKIPAVHTKYAANMGSFYTFTQKLLDKWKYR